MGHSRPLFLYFRLFNAVDSKQLFNTLFPYELRTSGIESNCSTKWATNTAPKNRLLRVCQKIDRFFQSSQRHNRWHHRLRAPRLQRSHDIVGQGRFVGHRVRDRGWQRRRSHQNTHFYRGTRKILADCLGKNHLFRLDFAGYSSKTNTMII